MPAFIAALAAAGTVGAVATLKNQFFTATPTARLIQVIGNNEQPKSSLAHKISELTTDLKSELAAVDDKYQHFVQEHLDPLLGKKRKDYVKTLALDNQNELTLSNEERRANHRLALGGVALVSAGLGILVNPFFTGLAVALGFLMVFRMYVMAYKYFQHKRKIGAIHLICIYFLFLWLGGYAAIGALGAVLLGVGFKIKAITEDKSRNNLVNLFQIQPDAVWVRHADGLEITIPFEQLRVGDTLVLQAGQTVPVDGVIIGGVASVDQHLLTGEAQPVEKTVNDPLLAATTILSGRVDVRVEKTGAETTAGQLLEILNNTSKYNADQGIKIMQLTDKLALPTLVLSAVSLPLIGPAGAVSLMGANTTVTTYMSNSLAMLNFLNLAAARGILIKNGLGLDQLSQVDTFIFDKTGTLTLEQFQIAQIHLLNDQTEDELLTLAAAAEMRQSHPIANAILTAAAARQLELPALDQIHYEVGYGLKAWLPQGIVRVGSHRFMDMENILLPPHVEALMTQAQAEGHSLLMIALDEKLVGCIELQSIIRPEAKAIVAGLQQRGLDTIIISGDQEAPTRKLAAELGMSAYFANTLPDQKANIVQQLQDEGHKVCFIGDGINDALAMRQSNVSISLRGATSAATDTAQIILMQGDLKQLLPLFEIAQDFKENLTLNFRFTAAASLVVASGILLAGFTFAATELFYVISLLGGLGIAMKPALTQGGTMDN
ncbi:MAG: heavy metal translocating P-type ATPase [Caldilineaceae bacterium]|nr:heavy metal translocating P-type ATPase [Caldilineaceae bacterium]MCB0095774.1 heavy metal translocating P-type ATPase [Caldilineaceae bacterium]